jgi:hypothetical protein
MLSRWASFVAQQKTKNNTMIKTKTLAALAGSLLAFGALADQASAAFANGDLILSFQATGGQGATTTYVANLGAGYSYRDATANSLGIINLGADLSSIYGASWMDRADLFISINGNFQAGYNPTNQGGPVTNGDARNTIYVGRSKTNNDPTTYSQYSYGASAMGTVGTQMQTYNNTVASALASANSAQIATSAANTIEEFTTPAGSLLVNFSTFSADFAQGFASGSLFNYSGNSYEGALSLQRINRVDGTTGVLTGNVVVPGITAGSGSNEGMFAIRSNGQVDYIAAVPEPSTIALCALGLGAAVFHIRRRRK